VGRLIYDVSLAQNFRTVVADVHDVTGLIHGPTAGADASCIYLESFSFSPFSVPQNTRTRFSPTSISQQLLLHK